jgi:hypothetical protein
MQLDLYVFGPTGNLVGSSGSFTSAEQVDIPDPAAGLYTVAVHGYETDGPAANYKLFTWALGGAAEGNLTASGPVPATGPSGTVTVTWSGLEAGLRYLGAVSYSYGPDEVGRTLVSIRP